MEVDDIGLDCKIKLFTANLDTATWLEYFYEQGKVLNNLHTDSLHAIYERHVTPFRDKFSVECPTHKKRTKAIVSQFRQVFSKTIENIRELESTLVSEFQEKFPEISSSWINNSNCEILTPASGNNFMVGSKHLTNNNADGVSKEESIDTEEITESIDTENVTRNSTVNMQNGPTSETSVYERLEAMEVEFDKESLLKEGTEIESESLLNVNNGYDWDTLFDNHNDEMDHLEGIELREEYDKRRMDDVHKNFSNPYNLDSEILGIISTDIPTQSEISVLEIIPHKRAGNSDRKCIINGTVSPVTVDFNSPIKTDESLASDWKLNDIVSSNFVVNENENLSQKSIDTEIFLKMTPKNELKVDEEYEDNWVGYLETVETLKSATDEKKLSIFQSQARNEQGCTKSTASIPTPLSRDEKEARRRALCLSISDEDVGAVEKNRIESPVSSNNIGKDDPKLTDRAVVKLVPIPTKTVEDLKNCGFVKIDDEIREIRPTYTYDTDHDYCASADSDSSLQKLNRTANQLKYFNGIIDEQLSCSQNSSPSGKLNRSWRRRVLTSDTDADDELQNSENECLEPIQFKREPLNDLQSTSTDKVFDSDSSSGSEKLENECYNSKDEKSGDIQRIKSEKRPCAVDSKDRKKCIASFHLTSSSDDSEAENRRRALANSDSDENVPTPKVFNRILVVSDSDDTDVVTQSPVKNDSSHKRIRKKRKFGKRNDSAESLLESSDESDILSITSNSSPMKIKDRIQTGKGDGMSSDQNYARKRKKRRTTKIEIIDLDDVERSGNQDETKKVPVVPVVSAILKRKNIRQIMSYMDLEETTRVAEKQEEERKKRVAARQKLFKGMFGTSTADVHGSIKRLVLDIDPKSKKPIIEVDETIVSKLKPHQVEGIKFLYTTCLESLDMIKKNKGGGCILAHCMGLGKTLQAVGFTHTILGHTNITGIKTVLVVCPLNTVNNWCKEYEYWLKDADKNISLHSLWEGNTAAQRTVALKAWQKTGGVGIMHYERFRVLVHQALGEGKGQKVKECYRDVIHSTLLDPGPDMIICDEGHLLKNHESQLSIALSQIKTIRRVVLTGTPLQNNLTEYHTMMNFVKPNLLGNLTEFSNRFGAPIKNGQCKDSSEADVRVMKRRAHVLHSKLEGCVQRLDYTVLVPFLPPKYEYCIIIKLSEKQKELYRYYLKTRCAVDSIERGKRLLEHYANFVKIIAHPVVLTMKKPPPEVELVENNDGSLTPLTKTRGRKPKSVSTKSSKEEKDEQTLLTGWWSSIFQKTDEMYDVTLSGKIMMLIEILRSCEALGDRVLVFSQYLTTLTIIEQLVQQWDLKAKNSNNSVQTRKQKASAKISTLSRWRLGMEYFRIDGSTKTDDRQKYCDAFNDKTSCVAKLFLISTKAGGLGINLYGANRVVIFDCSWNPSNDMQSIFRVFRFGQEKPCYIYRFVAQATIEEKIYNRQVVKLSLSSRVVDEHQVERHFKFDDINELYRYNPDEKVDRPVPTLPKDSVLADLLISNKDWIDSYFEHDSLLVNKEDEELSEEERRQAWQEYRVEKGKERRSTPLLDNIGTVQKIKAMLLQRHPTAPADKIHDTAVRALTEINVLQKQKLLRMSTDELDEESTSVNEEQELQDLITNTWNSWTSSTSIESNGLGDSVDSEALQGPSNPNPIPLPNVPN